MAKNLLAFDSTSGRPDVIGSGETAACPGALTVAETLIVTGLVTLNGGADLGADDILDLVGSIPGNSLLRIEDATDPGNYTIDARVEGLILKATAGTTPKIEMADGNSFTGLTNDLNASAGASQLVTADEVKDYVDTEVAGAGGTIAADGTFEHDGFTAHTTSGPETGGAFVFVDEGSALRARTPDVTSGSGNEALAEADGIWLGGGKVALPGTFCDVLLEDDVAVDEGHKLVLSTNTAGRFTRVGETGAPASGAWRKYMAKCIESVASDADQGGGAGVNRVARARIVEVEVLQL